MGLLSTIRDWFRSLLGRDGETPDSVAEPAYKCAVCGTPVEGTGEECPLCRSTEIVSVDGGEGNRSRGPDARETVVDDESRTDIEVLGSDDVLSVYDQHWERRDSEYRVTLPDGTTKRIASRDDVRRLLFEQYGPPERE